MTVVYDESRLITSNPLSKHVDQLTCQSIRASRLLAKLYRSLGDEKQAANAIQAGAPAEERAHRYGLSAHISSLTLPLSQEDANEVQAEKKAWELLVEAQAGIAALHSMDSRHAGKHRGLRGARNTAKTALCRAVKGYGMAFPEEMVRSGVLRAISSASEYCARVFVTDLAGEHIHEGVEGIQEKVCQEVLRWLLSEIKLSI